MEDYLCLFEYCYPKDLSRLLEKICEIMAGELQAERCFFFLVDPNCLKDKDSKKKDTRQKEQFSSVFHSMFPKPELYSKDFPIHEISRLLALDVLENASTTSLEEKDIYCISDIKRSKYSDATVGTKYNNLSILCAPIVLEGANYQGAFYLDTTKRGFDTKDRDNLMKMIERLSPVWKGWLNYLPFPHSSLDNIIGKSNAIRKTKDLIQRFAPTPANVLIHGETGTGKELVAKAIHEISGRTGKFEITTLTLI